MMLLKSNRFTLCSQPSWNSESAGTDGALLFALGLVLLTAKACLAQAHLTNEVQRGEELARVYCSACHLQPEPQRLTKTEWLHHILPSMAQQLGIEPVNYEGMQDGRLLEEAHLFPISPMLPEADWLAIWEYYKTAAPSQPLAEPPKPALELDLKQFRARKINFHSGLPAICLVQIDAERRRFFVGDMYAHLLAAISPAGEVLARARVEKPPVRLVTGPSGMLVTLIGRFFPSDALEGSVARFSHELTGGRPLLANLRRPTDARWADLNQDGRDDLVVCAFGNRLGSFSWFENRGTGFVENVLLERPGATRSEIHDFNQDGLPDILVLTAQAREGLYLYLNQGKGAFSVETLIEQPPVFGYADFQLVDFNRDGHMDLLTVNGDNGDFPTPRKPYHGLRLYLNDGANRFQEKWFYPLAGAYKALAADFDADGDLDVAAIAYYPDFSKAVIENFVFLENRGEFQFTPRTLAESAAGRWMVMDAGDVDGDGDLDLVLGSFIMGPTTIPVPQEVREHWKTQGAAVLLLENQRR